jgi:hypothetical protein
MADQRRRSSGSIGVAASIGNAAVAVSPIWRPAASVAKLLRGDVAPGARDFVRHIDAQRAKEVGAQRRAAAMHTQHENDRPALYRIGNCRDLVRAAGVRWRTIGDSAYRHSWRVVRGRQPGSPDSRARARLPLVSAASSCQIPRCLANHSVERAAPRRAVRSLRSPRYDNDLCEIRYRDEPRA